MKKFVKVSAVAIALALVTGTVALANYGDDNELSGKVRLDKTTQSVSKARVFLYTKGGHRTDTDKTGKNGRYKFKNLTEKKYIVKARATGFRSPKDAKKETVSSTVKVDGNTKKNLYLVNLPVVMP